MIFVKYFSQLQVNKMYNVSALRGNALCVIRTVVGSNKDFTCRDIITKTVIFHITHKLGDSCSSLHRKKIENNKALHVRYMIHIQ